MVRPSSTLSEVWVMTILVVLFGVFCQSVAAQKSEEPPMRTIYPCDIKLKMKGAEFAFTSSYWVTTDAEGKNAKVTPWVGESQKLGARFIDQDNFMTCVKKWILEPSSKFIVQFRVTTTSLGSSSEPLNYVLILGPGESGQKLKIELPWSAEDTLIVPDKSAKPANSKAKH